MKKRKVSRIGGSLMVALDPEFMRNAGIEEGDDIYIIADRKVLLITHDEKEARAITNDLHDFAHHRIRMATSEDQKSSAGEKE